MIGTQLAQFKIDSKLGEGGMGAVYRATDARLGREVAVKVLPPELVAGSERIARFEREARMLASLSHPNIATIHEVGAEAGVHFLVMELAPGEALSERIARGPMAVDEATSIAIQIAEALEAAHEMGIVHRDLKPANIQVTPAGDVKVLDFGLAKALRPPSTAAGSSKSATLTAQMTAAGTVLGSAAYMSPEQAKGLETDARTDIWAFGVLLVEMLTGRPLFARATFSETLAAVLETAPDLSALPAEIPASVRRVIDRCLSKEPKQRLHHIADARIELQASGSSESPRPEGVPTAAAGSRLAPSQIVAWVVAGLGLVAAVLGWVARPTSPSPHYELSLTAPRGSQLVVGYPAGSGALSPDGRQVVFKARGESGAGLWIRSLDSRRTRLLAKTEDGFYPFWSPDGRNLAFFAERGGLYRVDVDGGLPVRIADAPLGRGGTWGEDGTILMTPVSAGTIHRLSAEESTAQPVTELDPDRGETAHYWPRMLPDGRHFVYFIKSLTPEHQGIFLGSLDGDGRSTERRRLVASSSSGVFVPARSRRPPLLLWVQEGELLARELDIERGELRGPTWRIAEDVRVYGPQSGALFDASPDGTLVHASRAAAALRLVWFDREGRRGEELSILSGAQPGFMRLSAQADRLVYNRIEGEESDIWIHDLTRDSQTPVTTSTHFEEEALLSPDGRSIVFDREKETVISAIDGSSPSRVIEVPDTFLIQWFTRDLVLASIQSSETSWDLCTFSTEGDPALSLLLERPGTQLVAQVSRDSRWLAYVSEESGKSRVFVARLLLDSGVTRLGATPVALSIEGAESLAWRVDGSELFVFDSQQQLWAIPLSYDEGSIRAATPTRLFRGDKIRTEYDLRPDRNGARFLFSEEPFADTQALEVVVGWDNRLTFD